MKRPLFGTIRHKLMAFVVLMSAILLWLVWLLNVQLLQPFYNRKIYRDLEKTATAYVALIEKYGTIQDPTGPDGFVQEFYDALNQEEYVDLLTGKCVEIGNSSGLCLLHTHQLSSRDCLLHPVAMGFFGDRTEPLWDNRNTVTYRLATLKNEDMHFTLEEEGMQQMVVCKNVENTYTVIVSMDLERIGQAADIIGFQMPVIALILLAVSILGAYLFSRWFTRPVTKLSLAARELAKGNYRVRVTPETSDEIGVLAQDFNTMADEVEKSAELQRDLIANVSHDLRTPLTLIKGYAETVRDLTGDDKEKREGQLTVIIDETDRLSALVNSVMELSKYSSGAIKLNPVRFDLAQLCDEVAYRFEDLCRKNGWHLEQETDTPCEVWADPDSLSRVIYNLLSNATHHIGADGYLAIRALPKADGGVRVEVEDHGPGIAKEDLPHLFDKYYRSRSDAGKVGTGLGLSITKAILVAHGFAFGVNSELGKGSTFWFETSAPPKELK